jgi:hypothetical protein
LRTLQLTKYDILAFFLPLAVYTLTLHGVETGPLFNVVATQFSMWKYHSFALGSFVNPITDSVPNTDTFLYHGNYYDTYAPGFSLISFPFAALGFLLDGGVLKHSGYAILLVEFFLAISGAFASLLVYRMSRWYAEIPESLLTAFVLAFGTSVWPFATATYNHDATLVFSLASVFFIMGWARAKGSASSYYSLVLSAICLGVSSLIDYVAILFAIPLLGYIVYVARRKMGSNTDEEKGNRRKISSYVTPIVLFVAPFVALAGINLLYNEIIFGSATTFPEQFWTQSSQSGILGVLSRFSLYSLATHSTFNLISPYRGLLLLSPVLIFGFYGVYKMLRAAPTKVRIDGVLLLSLFLANFLSYSAWDVWTGGNTYGPRFLIFGLPYLVIPIAIVLYEQNRSRLFKALFVTLFAFSSVIQGAGAFTYAYQPGVDNVFVYQPISYAFPELLKSQFGVWWYQVISNQIVAWSIMIAIFVTLWAFILFVVPQVSRAPVASKT